MSLNKPSKELVIDLINADNNRSFDITQINVRSPAPYSGANARNTVAVAEAVEGKGYYGATNLYYDRLDFNVALENNNPDGLELMVPNDGFIDTVEVCDRLNRMFNLRIGEVDIVKTEVDSAALPAVVTLTAKSDSLAWFGNKTMTLVPDRPMWAPTFSSLELAGFVFPTGDVSGLTDPVAIANTAPSFVDGNGDLLFGTQVPAGGFLVSSNTELELGIGARYANGAVVVPDSDNAYTLNLQAHSTWKLAYTVGLLEVADLSAAYGTCMVITRSDSTTCTLVLKKAVTGYEWECVDKGVLIPADYAALDDSVVQGFLDAETLREALTPTASSNGGAPLGVFSVRLQARRKNSVAPRLIATILVKATNN